MKHVYNLLTCWAVVCDVWYLDPQVKGPDETPVEFSNRVKEMIAKKAGLVNVPWNGYLKYLQPNESFKEERPKIYAEELAKKLEKRAENTGEISLPPSPPESRRKKVLDTVMDLTNQKTQPSQKNSAKKKKV